MTFIKVQNSKGQKRIDGNNQAYTLYKTKKRKESKK
jgi:hypothetical protein